MVVPPALGKSCPAAKSPALPHGPDPARSRSCRELAPKGESPGKSTGANPLGLGNKSLWSFGLLSQQRRGVWREGTWRDCLIQPQTVGRWLQRVFEARAGGCAAPLNSLKCFTTPAVRGVFLIFANCHPLCVLLAHGICLSGMKQTSLFSSLPGRL